MSIRHGTPCDIDGICPYEAESSYDCEYFCSNEEPEDTPEIWEDEIDPPLVPTSHKLMPLWEIFTFLRACKFNPKEEVCYISQTKGYVIISKRDSI